MTFSPRGHTTQFKMQLYHLFPSFTDVSRKKFKENVKEYKRDAWRETIRKNLEVNELDLNIVYDRKLWCNLIHVANPT